MKYISSLVLGVISCFVMVQLQSAMVTASTTATATTATTTTLEGRLNFPDMSGYDTTTRITLNNGEYTTYARSDGSFRIYNVPSGIHQLDIDSTIYHFGQVKIQLLDDSMDAPKCLEYAFPGAAKRAIKYPLNLSPKATKDYFQVKKGFSILALFKNPMVLMMVFSAGMMIMMPKMMEGLDPEEKARMKQQMQAQQDPTKMLSQMWGDITGDGGSAEDDQGAASSKSRKERRMKR